MSIKEHDIFTFRYNEKERERLFLPDHCFDGQLVAFKNDSGVYLQDSYWLFRFQPRGDGHCFTPEEAAEKGELVFVCNLDEVEIVDKYKTDYYADEDVFNLSYQHGCYPYYAIRKGAKRSSEKMLTILHIREQEVRSEIKSAIDLLQRISETRQRITDGFTDEVYLP